MPAHIRYDTGMVKATATSDPGWYDAAKQVGKRSNERARRGDIVAVVSETAGHGAPACFVPALAELHLNRTMVPMGDPKRVDLSDRLWCLEHSAAVGAMEHEASHARHTRWDMEAFKELGANARMIDVIVTLEEPRIERNAVRNHADARPYLRACALDIVAKDFHIANTPYGAAAAAGLLLARVDAGVLTKGEVAAFRKQILTTLEPEQLDKLEKLWKRFLVLFDTDYRAMVRIAREWIEAVGMDPEAPEGEDTEAGEDDGSDLSGKALFGEGEPSDEPGDGKTMSDRIKARGRKLSSKVDEEIVERRGEERRARKAAAAKADTERRAEAKGMRDKAFPPGHGYGEEDHSHFVSSRGPTMEERIAAKNLSKVLERLDYHDRVVTKRNTATPPGRLRGKAAVTIAAARSQGRQVEVEPWRGKVRRVVNSTPLSIGLACDISGSMMYAMKPLASAQWVLANAGAHIDAKVSTVHFGTRVHGILRAGVPERRVRLYEARAGHEAFKDAALALDGELNLIEGRGARLLFVLSDGEFVNAKHHAYAEAFIPLAISRGVAVVFLQFTESLTTYGASAIDCQDLTPAQVAILVGQVAADEIKRLDSGQ